MIQNKGGIKGDVFFTKDLLKDLVHTFVFGLSVYS